MNFPRWIGIIALGLLITALHLTWIARTNPDRLAYLESGKQFQYHQVVIAGEAGNPWQYRILAPFLLEGLIRLTAPLQIPHQIALIFVALRTLQNIAIFALVYRYFEILGYRLEIKILGLSLVMWGMVLAAYDSDLAFNTYFDVIFYLLGVLLIWGARWAWLIPLMVLATLNRETSGLIPILAGLTLWFVHQERRLNRDYALIIAALGLYFAIFAALRLHYGLRPSDSPTPGLDALIFNLTDLRGWVLVTATLGLTPLLASLSWQKMERRLQIWGIVILPLWFIIHLSGGIMAETRLFLVPYILILVPASLSGLIFTPE